MVGGEFPKLRNVAVLNSAPSIIDRISRAGLAALAMLGVASLPAFAGDVAAATQGPSRAVVAFDQFLKVSSPVCVNEPSGRCVDIGFAFADTDHDGKLSLAEIKSVRSSLQDWMAWKGDAVPAKQRTNIALGLIVLDIIGTDKLFASMNTSGTGKLTRAELLADVKLDNRPLGVVLQDPNSVDRKAIAAKLGRAAPVVGSLMDQSGQAQGKDTK
jgi:Ca2+-binding EF-hand superfamily protein